MSQTEDPNPAPTPATEPQGLKPDPTMRGIIGLANLGNTCYMNASLQALRHCPEWTLYCKKNGELEKAIHTPDSSHAKVALAYQDLIHSIWAGTGPAYVRPLGFYEQLRQIVKGTIYEDFIRRTPQDAHEFLMWVLDQMYMATQREVSIVIQTPNSLPPMTLKAVEGWKAAFEKQYSPLTDLIFGMMRIQYLCGGCSALHTRWETFNSLKVQPREGKTLLESVEEEFKDEEIEGYHCDACKQHTTTKKNVTIWRLPKTLILTLKRFTPMGTRDNTAVSFGDDTISFGSVFSPESQEKTKEKQYKVFATVDHHGNHMGGHYTSQCFNPIWKCWHMYDDEASYKIEKPQYGRSTYIMFLR